MELGLRLRVSSYPINARYCVVLRGIGYYCVVLPGIEWYWMLLDGIVWYSERFFLPDQFPASTIAPLPLLVPAVALISR